VVLRAHTGGESVCSSLIVVILARYMVWNGLGSLCKTRRYINIKYVEQHTVISRLRLRYLERFGKRELFHTSLGPVILIFVLDESPRPERHVHSDGDEER